MNILARVKAAIDLPQSNGFTDERHFGDDTEHNPAAVLIAITDRPEPGVILTQRLDNMRSHPGQVAFPGGKIDAGDADAVAAALREAEEELALPADQVDVLGATDVYISGSGYQITPVLGIIPPDMPLTANPDEVEDWFEVPLNFLLDQTNFSRRSGIWMGKQRQYYDMTWQDRRIWGVTAGIIVNLARRVHRR